MTTWDKPATNATVLTARRLPRRWCRAPTALRDAVRLRLACASVVDELTRRSHEQRPTHHLRWNTMKGGA